MAQSLADLSFHLIFSTKHRLPTIIPEIADRLYAYIGATCQAEGCRLLIAGGMPDHIHLLVSWSRTLSLSEGLRILKSSSSRWVHDTFPNCRDFAWQDGYGAFTVSRSVVPAVTNYIGDQVQHHRAMTFHDELRQLLKKHGVDYDERYLWD